MEKMTVIEGNREAIMAPCCTTKMDSEATKFSDFVVVGWNNKEGKAVLIQNADAITLGYAYKMVAKAFNDSYNGLTPEEKQVVDKEFRN